MHAIADIGYFVNDKYFIYVANEIATMANRFMSKEESITIRTRSEIKAVLQELAKKGYRTLSQQCEMILLEWLKKNGHLKKDEEGS